MAPFNSMNDSFDPDFGTVSPSGQKLRIQMDIRRLVNSIYGNDALYERILAAITASGLDPARLNVEDLAPMDQLHGGELATTRLLASKIEITSQTMVLDAGCGIGGPARYLAKNFGCRVVGIDLSERFVTTAKRLNDLFGLSHRITCSMGDITNTQLEDRSFDVVLSQGVLMNIEDKAAALRETYRVLRPGGFFLVQMAMQGIGPPDYPVMWASGPDMDFLCTSHELHQWAAAEGLEVISWDETPVSQGQRSAPPPPSMNQSIVMGFADNAAAWANTLAAFASGRVVPAVGVLTKVTPSPT